MSNSDYAAQRLDNINTKIAAACKASGRSLTDITLIGASKKQADSLIQQFVEKGLSNVGENYLQEAVEKQINMPNLDVKWHFIGQIQSNKTKIIAQHFTWVHGVDRLKIAQRLASQNPHTEPINILVQLNPDNEDSKAGVTLEEAPQLCDEISQIQGVNLRGFMMIPKARKNTHLQASVFAQAKALQQATNQRYGLTLDHLSMGMSADLVSAIQEGSTMVRIGTDLFGARI